MSPLVLDGTKTASGGIKWVYEAEGTPIPEQGDLCVVTYGHDDPFCIVETVEVQEIPYDKVGEDLAWEGGGGDRSLADWRRIYWDFIVFECVRFNREPDRVCPWRLIGKVWVAFSRVDDPIVIKVPLECRRGTNRVVLKGDVQRIHA
ncbi:MAG: ASCH domain-containing protein [Dehalococcoidia bacterium]